VGQVKPLGFDGYKPATLTFWNVLRRGPERNLIPHESQI
jgi:hypothetical protein